MTENNSLYHDCSLNTINPVVNISIYIVYSPFTLLEKKKKKKYSPKIQPINQGLNNKIIMAIKSTAPSKKKKKVFCQDKIKARFILSLCMYISEMYSYKIYRRWTSRII